MRLAYPAFCLSLLVSVATGRSAAADVTPGGEKPNMVVADDDGVEFGVGLRLRSVWVPKAVLELFVDRSAGGAQNLGYGVDLTRRRGTTELQLGFEYERVNVGEGVWINKGDDVSIGDEADYVLSPE